jgi:serine/threonine protein kinase
LRHRLKRQKTIPEKDAKAIFMQIMSGLRYLDRPLSYGTTTSAAGGACASGPGTASGVREDGRYFDADEDGHGNNNNHHGGGGGGGSSKSNKKFSIIHYDLKPANILFDEIGDVKITGTVPVSCLSCLHLRCILFCLFLASLFLASTVLAPCVMWGWTDE